MASFGRWKIPQTRSGRRSISVAKLLKRETEGKLFKKHSFKLEGEDNFQGLDVAIENDKGSVRKGTNADGTKWETKYKTPYGYLRGTKGADGEEVDCYIGPKRDAISAFVVHQKKDDGSYDEDTVMLGFRSKGEAKADILRHYDDPKYVGTIDAIPMAKLHELVDSKKKLVKISAPTHDRDYVDNDFGSTDTPAKLRRRRLELPARDEVDALPRHSVEHRQDSRGTLAVGEFATPGGFDDLGKTGSMKSKISAAMETLGEMSRSWEVPSDDEDQAGSQSVERTSPFGVTISELSPVTDIEATKGAEALERAFLDELQKIGQANHGIMPWVGPIEDFQHFVGETIKQADVSRDQAQHALSRLDELEHQRPTIGQLGRGALVGSVVGPVASNINKLISKGEIHSPREILGQLAGGAIFGTATPLLKHKVETGTERKTLKDFIDSGHGGRLATQIENKLGTP